jgi:uncharacterized repeat protein (TIGR03803 family)
VQKPLSHVPIFGLAFMAVFALVLPARSWAAPKYKILHAFTGGRDGGGLWGSLLLDQHGNVYGTTALSTVFELSPGSGGEWSLRVLHTFNGNDGDGPLDGLIFDQSGNLYGTTANGGGPGKNGTVFRLTPSLDGGWKETVLYRFKAGGGESADGGVIMGKDGNLYGAGIRLSPGVHGWKLTVLHKFPSYQGDGIDPYAVPTFDAYNNLYGTTAQGGADNRCGGGCGTVYELSPTSSGKWKETILHTFQAYWDGSYPSLGALVLDTVGNLYGTADGGNTGHGVIFRMSRRSNGHWEETALYNLGGGANGDHPGAGVVMDQAGNLYGTTIAGGSGCDCGVVYKLAPGKNGEWTYTVLHTFVGTDGAQPDANLILDDKGNLYGTTATGGPGGYGVAFQVIP